jgi:cell division initiation protein
MIDLTPLDIRKKKGDFARGLRGYDPSQVDQFLDLVAERLEGLVRENLTLRERSDRLAAQVEGQEGREKAVQEALVTAQALREAIEEQARREAELIRREADGQARAVREEVHRFLQERRRELQELHRTRIRFLRGFRTFIERELDGIEAEESNPPDPDFDLDLIFREFGPDGVGSLAEEGGSEAEVRAAPEEPDSREGVVDLRPEAKGVGSDSEGEEGAEGTHQEREAL